MKTETSPVASHKEFPVEKTPVPTLDLGAIEKPSLTLCRIRDLFQRTTGLDFFLFFQRQPMGKWAEESFARTIELPRYCQLVRSNPLGLARCLSSHQQMTRRAFQCKRPVCQCCHAGLTTLHFPVSITDKGCGDIQTVCALRHGERAHTLTDLQQRVEDLEIPEKSFAAAIDELQVISKRKGHQVIEWLELVASYLAETSVQVSAPDIVPRRSGSDSVPERPSVEHRIRLEVGRSVPLPSWRGERSTGGTATLVERVMHFVEQHDYMPLSTQVIAQALGFELSYFAKTFKQFAGETLTIYLRRTRLRHAQRLLRDPFLSIVEVAERTGFADASYFTRVFRGALGMTPTQFRQLSGENVEP